MLFLSMESGGVEENLVLILTLYKKKKMSVFVVTLNVMLFNQWKDKADVWAAKIDKKKN